LIHTVRNDLLLIYPSLGEAVIITRQQISRRRLVVEDVLAPCIFEYVYFARQDSIIDGISVYKARLAMGEALADQVIKVLGDKNDIDVVIPVPDTSRAAALQCSRKLNIVYREGFNKNRYVGRTFIMPGQQVRRKNVRRKLNAMALEFHGKNVLLVDGKFTHHIYRHLDLCRHRFYRKRYHI
jgi:amidophosphoribosyltransferase